MKAYAKQLDNSSMKEADDHAMEVKLNFLAGDTICKTTPFC